MHKGPKASSRLIAIGLFSSPAAIAMARPRSVGVLADGIARVLHDGPDGLGQSARDARRTLNKLVARGHRVPRQDALAALRVLARAVGSVGDVSDAVARAVFKELGVELGVASARSVGISTGGPPSSTETLPWSPLRVALAITDMVNGAVAALERLPEPPAGLLAELKDARRMLHADPDTVLADWDERWGHKVAEAASVGGAAPYNPLWT